MGLLEELYIARLFKMNRDKLNIGKEDKAGGRMSGAAARTGNLGKEKIKNIRNWRSREIIGKTINLKERTEK